jgi:hypothetical protein
MVTVGDNHGPERRDPAIAGSDAIAILDLRDVLHAAAKTNARLEAECLGVRLEVASDLLVTGIVRRVGIAGRHREVRKLHAPA